MINRKHDWKTTSTYHMGGVMGALYRKTDPKIATAQKTQSRSKDQNDKGKFKVESNSKT